MFPGMPKSAHYRDVSRRLYGNVRRLRLELWRRKTDFSITKTYCLTLLFPPGNVLPKRNMIIVLQSSYPPDLALGDFSVSPAEVTAIFTQIT
jgi:hypothetical protein